MSDPLIMISSCGSATNTGSAQFNGGYKLYNLWVKLLRQNGYEAYIVTWDGNYIPWLIEHQPVVGLDQFRRWQKEGQEIRAVSGWLDSPAFLAGNDFYFCDCELAYTSTSHFDILKSVLGRIKKVGVNNKNALTWYSDNFPEKSAMLIPEWSDEDFWKPSPVRVKDRVGYMAENAADLECLHQIQDKTKHLNLEFINIVGTEDCVLSQMQTCDIFIGLNRGKHPIYGEGCPRTQQEAMHVGAVVVAFDVIGNREYIDSGYNGFLVQKNDMDAMATWLEALKDEEFKEQKRQASISFSQQYFSSPHRIDYLKKFLDL
jgi:hypothetical protein